jgi:hypothetical protein
MFYHCVQNTSFLSSRYLSVIKLLQAAAYLPLFLYFHTYDCMHITLFLHCIHIIDFLSKLSYYSMSTRDSFNSFRICLWLPFYHCILVTNSLSQMYVTITAFLLLHAVTPLSSQALCTLLFYHNFRLLQAYHCFPHWAPVTDSCHCMPIGVFLSSQAYFCFPITASFCCRALLSDYWRPSTAFKDADITLIPITVGPSLLS